MRNSRTLSRAALVAAMPLCFGLVTSSQQAVGAAAAADAKDTTLYAQAFAFRESHGFLGDPSLVLSTLSDPAYSTEMWGVPLSVDEIAELERRLEVRRAIAPAFAMADTLPDSAGQYVDQLRGGMPVLLTTGTAANLQQKLNELKLDGLKYDIRQVDWTLAQLTELHGQIVADWSVLRDLGIELQTVGIDVRANSVGVGVAAGVDAAARLVLERYGSHVSVYEEPIAAGGDACNSRADCLPIKGGIRMYRSGYANAPTCTTGMLVRKYLTSNLYVLTAGHCVELNGGIGIRWKHHTTIWGTARYETWATGADADAGLIQIDSEDYPASKWEFFGVSKFDIRHFNDFEAGGTQYVGDQVCRSGAASGYDCGLIDLTNVTRDVDGRAIDHQWQVDFDACPGDSGGPYYIQFTIYGIHSDSTSGCNPGTNHAWYSPMDWVVTTLGNGGWDVILCLHSDCTLP
jgi:hypothetical protein